MESPEMSPPRKDSIPNQDINRLSTKKLHIPPQLARFPPGFKSVINKTEDDRNDSTDNSRTDKEDSVNNLKYINNKDIDYKCKYDNSLNHNSNESIINKTKEEESLIEILVSMNFRLKILNYV